MADEVWIQLYVGKEKSGRVFGMDIASLSQNRITDLAKAVIEERKNGLSQMRYSKLLVYKPGTEFPPKEEDQLRPSKPVPGDTTSKNPLRVLAPAIANQQEPRQFFPFINCIYILCSKEDNGVVQPIATAFTVNEKFALTAGHTIAKQGLTGVELFFRNFCLTAHLDRKGNQTVPEGELITVKVVKVDVNQDWAVLERLDNKIFKETLPVATLEEDLPTPGTMNLLTFYHCPVSLFQYKGAPVLHVTPTEGSVGLIGTETIKFQDGLFYGSCGGPYVYRGKAIAIHIERDSSTHPLRPRGIIIRAHSELMKYINGTYMHQPLAAATIN